MGSSDPQHTCVRWDPPDIVHITLVGHIDGDQMRRVNEEGIRYGTGRPYVFTLLGLSRVDSMTAEARALAPEPAKVIRCQGVALFGASYQIRVITGFVSRVGSLRGKAANYPIRFFETEAEARAWIAERRAMLDVQP